MKNLKWSRAIGVLAIVAICAPAFGSGIAQKKILPEGIPNGVMSSDLAATFPDGDIAYSSIRLGNFVSLPDNSELTADGVVLDGESNIGLWYFVKVIAIPSGFGFCATENDADWDANTALWSAAGGGVPGFAASPMAPIPGSECSFTGIPKLQTTDLQCKLNSVALPSNGFYITFQQLDTGNCAGWRIGDRSGNVTGFSDPDSFLDSQTCADVTECSTFGDPAVACNAGQCEWPTFGESNPNWISLSFGDTVLADNFIADVVVQGNSWACCDDTTFTCSNTTETACQGIFTQGVLCNDLATPCSEGGACCNLATGACSSSFASQCNGFLEEFTAGQSCGTLATPCTAKGDNVPTVSQWGMIVLSALLLTGLTVKFGRRRSATA